MSVELPCPFCILNKANTQVCNFIVTFDKMVATFINGEGLSQEQKRSLGFIVLMEKKNKAVRVGQKLDREFEAYDYYIERPLANTYKICFHTKDVNAVC